MSPFMIWVLMFSYAWGQQSPPQGESSNLIITRQAVQEISSIIDEDLKTAQSSIVTAYVNPLTYLTPYLTYETLTPDSLAQQLRECYTQQGFLLNNPSLLGNLLPSLPQKFFVANFDTEELFSKTNEQVLQTIKQASQGHTCAVVSKTETSYQIALGDCSQQLSAICISPITEFANTQYSTELAIQFKQDLSPILDLTIESLTYFSTQLVIAQPWINTIGVKLKELGELTSKLKTDIEDNVLSMSLFYKIILINQYVQQILHINSLSQAQVLTSTQEQIIQQDINDFKQRLQRLDISTQRQQKHLLEQQSHNQEAAQELLKQQSEQAQSLLQQLEKATKQLNYTQSTVSEDTTSAPNDDYEDHEEDSESGQSINSQFVDVGITTFTETLYDDIKALQASMDLCKSNQTTCCLLNQTNPTVPLWPTEQVLTFKEIMEYSIYNFYAAVLWSMLMFTILLISCCYTKKQSQQILQLQRKIKALQKCQCPNAAAGPSSSSRQPLLNKRKIISAINYAASSTS